MRAECDSSPCQNGGTCTDGVARAVQLVVVSHDLVTMAMLCDRVIWLHQGQLMADGPPENVLKQYYPYFVMPDVTALGEVPVGGISGL